MSPPLEECTAILLEMARLSDLFAVHHQITERLLVNFSPFRRDLSRGYTVAAIRTIH